MEQGIISAYNAINDLPITEGMIAICSLICALIVLSKLVHGVQEAMQDGQIDIRSFFKLFSTYIYMLIAITIAPPAFTLVEKGLAEMSDELTQQNQRAINANVLGVLDEFAKRKEAEIDQAGTMEAVLLGIKMPIELLFYTMVVYITKFLYVIFASARYLYLIILKIGTPIAIVCSLHEKTRHITETYLKNLFYCYIMLPCFLITNNFSDMIMEHTASGVWGLSQTEVSFLLLGIILKAFLFGKAFQYARQII